MRINIVVGNPPYNDDLYIPFVEMGHQIAREYSCFITPAKWQEVDNKDSKDKNENFRNTILPYFEKMVYYQVEGEIFGINMSSGLAYYLIGKHATDAFELKNKSSYFDSFRHDNVLWNTKTFPYNIKAVKIISKVVSTGNFVGFKFKGYKSKEFKVIAQKNRYNLGGSSNKCGRGIFYYNRSEQDGVFQPGWVTCSLKMQKGSELILGSQEFILESFDSELEAKSFMSYINSRLVRYINVTNLYGRRPYSYDSWRFVPDPGTFDHIFTDQELYKKYNLTQEEINTIESVIKERK
jgi:hypothetical protein